MSGGFLEERRRQSRLRAFGLGLGLVLALLFHVVLFWGPQVDYRPALESARVRRVLVARPYEPLPPPAPAAPRREVAVGAGAGTDEVSRAPGRSAAPEEGAAESSAAVGEVGGGELFRKGVLARDVAEHDVPVGEKAPDEDPSAELSPDAWAALMAELEEQGQKFQSQAKRAVSGDEAGTQEGAGAAGAGSGEEGYLDPRIRVKVISYPPTAIEYTRPAIPYPDLRLHRSQLQAGICRVYYRVWTDGSGRVVRRQLKSPSTQGEQARYKPFVEAVTAEVDEWPFDRVQAEVHVDVLFEIE